MEKSKCAEHLYVVSHFNFPAFPQRSQFCEITDETFNSVSIHLQADVGDPCFFCCCFFKNLYSSYFTDFEP